MLLDLVGGTQCDARAVPDLRTSIRGIIWRTSAPNRILGAWFGVYWNNACDGEGVGFRSEIYWMLSRCPAQDGNSTGLGTSTVTAQMK